MTGTPSTNILPAQSLVTEPVEIKIGTAAAIEITPKAESLRAARARLLSEYGPCAACHPELLIATARQIEIERSSV